MTILVTSVTKVLMMDIPGHEKPRECDFDVVAGTPVEPGVPDRAQRVVARVRILMHRGSVDQAADTAMRDAMPLLASQAGTMSADELSAAYAIVGMTRLLHGDVRLGYTAVLTALEYANETCDPAFVFWCKALQAAIVAVDGESIRAAGLVLEVQDMAELYGFDIDSWPLALARMFIRALHAEGCHPDIAEVLNYTSTSTALQAVPCNSRDGCWLGTILTLDSCVSEGRHGEFTSVVSTLSRVALGVDSFLTPPLIRGAVLYLLTLSLIQTGNIPDAMMILKSWQRHPDSAIDVDILCGIVYCNIGKYDCAIAKANESLKSSRISCLEGPITALLVRATAYEMLGNHELAQSEFMRAASLSDSLGNALPVLGLPIAPLVRIVVRSGQEEYISRSIVDGRLPQIVSAEVTEDAPNSLSTDITLTDGQRKVAQLLLCDLSLPAIAKQLYLSVNTVKSHVRLIYRKLSVRSKGEAIRVLTNQPWLLSGEVDVSASIEVEPRKA